MVLSAILLYSTLAACAVVIALAVRRYDLYRKEPWWAVGLAVLAGAAGMHLAGVCQRWAIGLHTGAGGLVSDAELAVLAGATEELAKLAGVLLIAGACRRVFEEPLDGIVYGSFVGLGAALEESVAVLTGAAGWTAGTAAGVGSVLPLQEPVRLAGHLIMGGIGGFGVGLLAMRPRSAAWCIPACWAGAACLHAAWNVAAFAAQDAVKAGLPLATWHTALPMAVMIGGMVLYRWLVARGAALTRRHLNVCDLRTRRCPPERDAA